MLNRRVLFASFFANLLSFAAFSFAGTTSLPRTYDIYPHHTVQPFKQWSANNGYCGEVSLMQAAMNQGEWMSQYNARLICGTGLSQSGVDGFCESHRGKSNYNAQLLLENPKSGDASFASAALCLQNAKLSAEQYPYWNAPSGMQGFRSYLTWVKKQTVEGNQVTIGVLIHGGHDQQYDHEVTVTRIGTNQAPNDSGYYDDDVLYFDDHHGRHGAESAYTFASLAKTRASANVPGASQYSILIPGEFPTYSESGSNGSGLNPTPFVGQNYAFSVSGPIDLQNATLPVMLSLLQSQNEEIDLPADPIFNHNFESPSLPSQCTNDPPLTWMNIKLKVQVTGLVVGVAYRLYEYDFDLIAGTGTDAAINVPNSHFNAKSYLATQTTRFTATTNNYSRTIDTSSNKVIAFRCVRADSN